MKQRITYFLPEGNRVDRTDIEVKKDGLNLTRAHEAAEEWRLTLSLNDLPDEVTSCLYIYLRKAANFEKIQEILHLSHELHIRWQSPLNEPLIPPLLSRLPTGLHVFFTPRNADIKFVSPGHMMTELS
jgi:hypothetical protein